MIRAVTLDAAGTLIAPREPVGVTYARIAARHGIATDAAVVDDAFRRALRAAPPLAFPDARPEARPACERAWWRDVVRRSLALDASDPRLDACVGALVAHFARAAAWRVFPDVGPALATLRRRGLRLGVVSNFDGRLPGLLAELALAPAVDAIVWSSAVGAAKPDRAIFEHALARHRVEAANAALIGDSITDDVAGARAAGMKAVLIDRRGRVERRRAPAGTIVIRSLDELALDAV